MFTETEKTILNALPKEYKYIYRFKDRALYIGKTSNTQDYHASFCMFGHLFKDVKAGAEPICFRGPPHTQKTYWRATDMIFVMGKVDTSHITEPRLRELERKCTSYGSRPTQDPDRVIQVLTTEKEDRTGSGTRS